MVARLSMPLAVHHNSEIAKVVMATICVVVFVVVALTWLPEMVAPQGGTEREANVGSTVRMIH
jgi:hypothetical protein